MTTETGAAPGATIVGLHHVGLVVRDMRAARARYQRLGFHVPPATFPALPPRPGAAPQAFGAGNTHAAFRHSAVELATVIDEPDADEPGDDVRLQPIEAPEAVLARLTGAIAETAGRLRAALDRFEGMHILAFHAPDADAAAARLAAAGVRHGGVHRLERPVETVDGPRSEPVGYLELDDPARTPEGRLAVAENPPEHLLAARRLDEHPNGAIALVEVLLCVPDAEFAAFVDRYRAYLDRPAGSDPGGSAGAARVFELVGSRLVLVPTSGLASVLPGERPPSLPAFVAHTVGVRDIRTTREHLSTHDVPFDERRDGCLVVPSTAALGCAVVFRQQVC